MFAYVYSCLPKFTGIYLYLVMFTDAYLPIFYAFLLLFNMFTHNYK